MAVPHEYGQHRLHSLLGVVPIGLFLIVHLTINYQATKGADAFNQAAGLMESLPYLLFLETVLIYLPILFHAIYGIYLAFTAKNNVGNYSFFRNWMFFIQRISGLYLVIFLAWHVWETRVAMALGTPLNYEMMVNNLSNPGIMIFYVFGILCAVYHFSNGLWSFCVHWGILMSQRSQRIGTYVTAAIFVLLTYVGLRTLFAFV
ncbi:succinate dehydrogenase cytochrome b558 subunit [Sporolactobacillus sp. CQH2019]|uniref:succinate dehydrogenase cytochrome b558 subunit n=1 Tax=Sporolactobacillus sp. CQH2019 TaxID=3023512 RepID=UPI002367879A|nr:succinate dehydrogenase cytochrome b558 subunit [Sporolactobacillus sp. CQH2019]MDD9148196.1 succinate dehydrogenase cytochrome b558 subunit [Sporolactobacillus sp. CQH2019]